jgi:hypothetical protein
MAQVGKTIVHPLTGERLTFLQTAATTGGDLLKISVDMAPGGTLARPHVHPRAVEEFEVLSGRIQLKTSVETRVAEAGESVVVRAALPMSGATLSMIRPLSPSQSALHSNWRHSLRPSLDSPATGS